MEKQKVFLVLLQSIVLGVLLQIVRKHKRSKVLIALSFPVAAAIFLAGWVLSRAGRQKQPRKNNVAPRKDNVHLEVIMLEEPVEITQ